MRIARIGKDDPRYYGRRIEYKLDEPEEVVNNEYDYEYDPIEKEIIKCY